MALRVEVIRVSRGQNLSYILSSESGEGIVIDPSYSSQEIWRMVREKGISLRYIINTHGHHDHTEGNKWLADKSGAQVAVHKADAAMLGDRPDLLLDDGDVLHIDEIEVKVLHTPGHTKGGICLLAEDSLFTGDTLFVSNCGRTDLSGGSDEELFASMQRLKKLEGKIKVFPGHSYWGERSTIEDERRTNPAMMSRNLEEFRLVP